MDKVLPILIETAGTARDRLAAAAQVTARSVAEALAVLDRLEQFRADYLRRSPAVSGRVATVQTLQDYQQFVIKLDHAIRLQRLECERRLRHDAESKDRLGEGQRRLMAFETLRTRRANALALKQGRRDQRLSDEFAARAVRAAQEAAAA